MIPKIIHYCWLSGDPYPNDIKRCMATWKKKLPDYAFMLWDTKRFDINSSLWVKQAFEAKKYAFAADYIRLYALYHYGGIYLDTDVEVLKSYDSLLELDMFLGADHKSEAYEVATWGIVKGSNLIKCILDYYDGNSFVKKNGTYEETVMPRIVVDVWKKCGYSVFPVQSINEAKLIISQNREKYIPIFPREWFCPLDWYTFKLHLTKETYSIHRYKGGWLEDKVKRERAILSKLGPYLPRLLRKIQNYFRKIKHSCFVC